MTDGEWKPMRAGRHHPVVCPGGAFTGPQGWIIILCTQGQMPGLWAAIDQPEMTEDPRFANNNTRLENLEAFDQQNRPYTLLAEGESISGLV